MKFKKFDVIPPPLTYNYLYAKFVKKLINTASSLFEWGNLPDSIDVNFLNYELIMSGKIGIITKNGQLCAVRGDVGGEINGYYKPTQYIYANPVWGSGSPTIGQDIAVIFLTSMDTTPNVYFGGLCQLIESTASLLADNELSLSVAQKNTRLTIIADADNEATRNSAEQTIKAIYNGEPYKVVNRRMTDTFNVNPLVTVRPAESMRQLIENRQYIWSCFLQELGINSNFNLKRERLTTSEVELNGECLDTLIDDIERTVLQGVEMTNTLYNTNITFKVKRYGEEQTNDDNTDTSQDTDTDSKTDVKDGEPNE